MQLTRFLSPLENQIREEIQDLEVEIEKCLDHELDLELGQILQLIRGEGLILDPDLDRMIEMLRLIMIGGLGVVLEVNYIVMIRIR